VDGIFLETHDYPAKALSDGPNALPLSQLLSLLMKLKDSAPWFAGGSAQS